MADLTATRELCVQLDKTKESLTRQLASQNISCEQLQVSKTEREREREGGREGGGGGRQRRGKGWAQGKGERTQLFTYNGHCTCHIVLVGPWWDSDGTYGVILRIVKAGCHPVAIAQVVKH